MPVTNFARRVIIECPGMPSETGPTLASTARMKIKLRRHMDGTYLPPKRVQSRDMLPPLPASWYTTVLKSKVWVDSIFLAAAIRNGADGRKVYRLHLLGKGLTEFLRKREFQGAGILPLDYVQSALKPFLGKNHLQTWKLAESWGVVHVWPEKNACVFLAHDRLSRSVFHNALKFTIDDARQKGSEANLLWVSHCEIRQSFAFQYQPGWSYKKENAYLTNLFMQGLNAFGIEWSLVTFGKALNRHPDTLTAHSKETGESVVKRCMIVPGVPSVPNWKKQERPEELQNNLVMPKPGKRARQLLYLLDKTRRSRSDSSTRYFLYHNKKEDSVQLARRIPNIHTNRLKTDKVKVRYSRRNLDWGCLSKLDSVRRVIERAHKHKFTQARTNRYVEQYHQRRTKIQLCEIRNKNIQDDDTRDLTVSVVEDSTAQHRVKLQRGVVGEAAHLNYQLGDDIGTVYFPSGRLTTSGRTKQARSKGRADNGQCADAPSLLWTNSPRRRPLIRGRRKYSQTVAIPVKEFKGHKKRKSTYRFKGKLSKELSKLTPNSKSGRLPVTVVSRKKLTDVHAKKASYCQECHGKVRAFPHPLYHKSCPHCGAELTLATVV